MGGSVIIEIDSLSFKYKGLQIFDNLNLKLKVGESALIIGKSGAGKSTLNNLIFGLLHPADGNIKFMQRSISCLNNNELAFMRRKIGYIEQFSDLLPSCSVIENVMMPLLIDGQDYNDSFDKAKSLLNSLDIIEQIDQDIHTLSGGQKKRACIARCIINAPKLILADEACASLDKGNIQNMINLIKDLQKHHQTAVIWCTHEDDNYFDYNHKIDLN